MAKDDGDAVKDVGAYTAALGALYGLVGLAILVLVSKEAQPIAGLPRNLVLGGPLFLVGGISVVAGLRLCRTRKAIYCWLSMLLVPLPSIAWVLFGVLSDEGPSINIITIIVVALPLLVLTRVFGALDRIRRESE